MAVCLAGGLRLLRGENQTLTPKHSYLLFGFRFLFKCLLREAQTAVTAEGRLQTAIGLAIKSRGDSDKNRWYFVQ
ncbi:hypothetical protein CWI81_07610 [Idiomarina seosinensis]|uniref:Uncharacterized protein n=1 Tax=Idiomarina seosinensis TaxID=281739 RepID=A0A432ZDK5_9GAMM|nr:hypothetical protein CWI81_07610 [Idiomarina seosinensis]